MNRRQKIILFLGVVVGVLMTAFPPMSSSSPTPANSHTPRTDTPFARAAEHAQTPACAYGFIGKNYRAIRYDVLSAQFIIGFLVTGSLVFAFGNKKTSKRIVQQ
jgi:hypothetical protein